MRSLLVGMHEITENDDTLNWRTYRIRTCMLDEIKTGWGRARQRFYTVASLCPRSLTGDLIQRLESRVTKNNGFPSGTRDVHTFKEILSLPWNVLIQLRETLGVGNIVLNGKIWYHKSEDQERLLLPNYLIKLGKCRC